MWHWCTASVEDPWTHRKTDVMVWSWKPKIGCVWVHSWSGLVGELADELELCVLGVVKILEIKSRIIFQNFSSFSFLLLLLFAVPWGQDDRVIQEWETCILVCPLIAVIWAKIPDILESQFSRWWNKDFEFWNLSTPNCGSVTLRFCADPLLRW